MHQVGGAGDDDQVGVVQVGDRGRVRGQLTPAGAALRAAHDRAAAEGLLLDARPQVRLLAGLVAGGDDRHRAGAEPLDRRPQPVGDVVERRGAVHRLQSAAAADQGSGDALLGLQAGERVAAAVAQPAVIDRRVVARQHPRHPALADGRVRVAADRALSADGRDVLDLPRPAAEPVGRGGERAHRAQLGDVAGELAVVRPALEGGDDRVRAAVLRHQLQVAGHVLAEPRAAVAEDAALAVELDQRRDRHRLGVGALGQRHAGAAGAVAEGQVLQRALAALVADRAVERVVDQEELEHRVLALAGAVGVRVHDHAVGDRRGAGGLQLGHALDLDQAHAAGADGRAQARLVAEHRHLDAGLGRRLDQRHALGHGHLAVVDGQRDGVGLDRRHQPASSSSSSSSSLVPQRLGQLDLLGSLGRGDHLGHDQLGILAVLQPAAGAQECLAELAHDTAAGSW